MNRTFSPSPVLADAHAHLIETYDLSKIKKIIKKAKKSDVDIIIDGGGFLPDICKIQEIQNYYKNYHFCIGIHPHLARNYTPATKEQIINYTIETNIVGIGETGLDYYYNNSPGNIQREVFREHIRLSREMELPLIIHCRDAFDDCFEILDEYLPLDNGILFHCFTGDENDLQRIIDINGYISIGGILTFPKADELRQTVYQCPVDRILIESDTPYLAPQQKRGRENEPANIKFVIEELAKLKNLSFIDIAYITTLNTRRFFKIQYNQEGLYTYKLGNRLYLNITNRCTNQCSFCIRNFSDSIGGHHLKLRVEPLTKELIEEIDNPEIYSEIVFCGYGEPLLRPDLIVEVAKWIKNKGGRVRVDTNGCASEFLGYDVLSELNGYVDHISVSLNASDENTYNKICKPKIKNAYNSVLETIKRSKSLGFQVTATMVDIPEVNENEVEKIAKNLGVNFRVRKFSY